MRALADALKDRKTRVALEADFRSEYGLSLKGIGTSELPHAEAARLLSQLPRDSRLYKSVVGGTEDPLTYQEHMMLALIDSARAAAYFSMIAAQAQCDKKAWGAVIKGMPQPIPRPGQKPEEKGAKALNVRPKDVKLAIGRIVQGARARAISGG